MKQYHKINGVFKRDSKGNMIYGEWATPELNYLHACTWEFTEKIDGTNIRLMFDGNRFSIGGKTDNAQLPSQLVDNLNLRYVNNQEMINLCKKKFPGGVCFYCEGCGPKIQKNGENYGNEQDIILFDIKIGDLWLDRENTEEIGHALKMRVTPYLGLGSLEDAIDMVKKGMKSKTLRNFIAEGIVARPVVPLFDRKGNRIIVKIKDKDFRKETQ